MVLDLIGNWLGTGLGCFGTKGLGTRLDNNLDQHWSMLTFLDFGLENALNAKITVNWLKMQFLGQNQSK